MGLSNVLRLEHILHVHHLDKSIQDKLELAEMISKSINSLALVRASTLHHLTAILTNPGHPSWLEISKCDKKAGKGDPGNYRPVSLSSVPEKVMEQIILSSITWHSRTTRGSLSASLGLWEAGPAWLTWAPRTRSPAWWMRERLWILSAWTSEEPLMPLPIALPWKIWLLMAWTSSGYWRRWMLLAVS